jgi:hypothetical protein
VNTPLQVLTMRTCTTQSDTASSQQNRSGGYEVRQLNARFGI